MAPVVGGVTHDPIKARRRLEQALRWLIVMFSSPPPPKNLQLTPSRRLHCEAKSGIMRQAGDNEKRLVLVWVQKESIGQVTAMVVSRIEQKPGQLCAGDNFQEVGYVVQTGLRARRHRKD
jgi:hypothetical protein